MTQTPDGGSDYAIDGEPIERPSLPGDVKVSEDGETAIDVIGRDLLATAHECARAFGSFHLALSGGHTPFPLYKRLMYDPDFRSLPWSSTHIWIVDERRAPFDDDTNNFKHINEIIIQHADIPENHVHPIPVDKDEHASALYEEDLRETLGARGVEEARLDFILLGMGDNGHTASLFPETSVLHERDRWVGDCTGPTVTPPPRVTMTYPLINDARRIAFLVLGKGKAEMINRVATGHDTFEEIPVKGIVPERGNLTWYLDRESAGG